MQKRHGTNVKQRWLKTLISFRMKIDDNKSTLLKGDIGNVYIERNYFTADIMNVLHRSKAFLIVDDGVRKYIDVFETKIESNSRALDPQR